MSEKVQRLDLDCHSYFYESSGAQYSGKKTAQALKIPLRTIEKIVEQGKVMKNGRGKIKELNLSSKIDDFRKILIHHAIYGFYQNKIGLTLDMLLSKLKEISAGTN